MIRLKALVAIVVAAAASMTAFAAQAGAMRLDSFPLGQSGLSGAVCEAVRDDDDPAVQMRGARAWSIRCRGWDVPLGRLYAYEYRGDQAFAADGPYLKTLATRARCEPASAKPLEGLTDVTAAPCILGAGQTAYAAYSARRRGVWVAAQGFPQIADVLEAGLRIAAKAAPPPKDVTQRLGGVSDVAPLHLAALGQAADQSAALDTLRERAYRRNLEWRFDAAGADFREIAQDEKLPTRTRAEAYLNWALNVSNTGRFARADALFDEADKMAARIEDAGLTATTLSYRALHLRNQKQFKESVQTAALARAKLEVLLSAADQTASGKFAEDAGGLVISADLAASLNRSNRAINLRVSQLSAAARVRIQIAQVLLTEATSELALGDSAQATASLQRARTLLSDPILAATAPWLVAQVETELAHIDLAAKRPDAARGRLSLALAAIRGQQAGSSVEGYLLLELGRADAEANDTEAALSHYAEGFKVFRGTRGSLGASADSAAAYFDLLLRLHANDPARRDAYAATFFTAASSVSRQGVADTIARLSARLSEGDSESAGLARALEDTRRRLQLASSQLAGLDGDAPAAKRAAAEAEARGLSAEAAALEQQLVAANPRYGQLVVSEVDLAKLQAKLRPGELYLQSVLLADRGYAMAISHDQVTPYRINIGAAEAARRVEALRAPFETAGRLPRYDVAAAEQLYETLFGPVRARVEAAQHLIYEPDAAVLSLPLAALVTDKASVALIDKRREAIVAAGTGVLTYNGVAWLGAKAATSLTVSASSFVQSRDFLPSAAKRSILGFGDAVPPPATDPRAFGGLGDMARQGLADADICEATQAQLLALPALPDTRTELAAVGRALRSGEGSLIEGGAFTDDRVRGRADLADYRVLYFATHGLLPRPGGCLPQPALVTSLGADGSDALLDASEILDLKLDADLVVLSACDTGGGAFDQTGVADVGGSLGGLTRAFIYAGARGLVVSHWQVDSRATTRLMVGMFGSPSTSQAEALKASELSLMNSQDQYSHPYYWAAFTVVGDGARPMPAPAP